jgi:hypothetical protein
MALMLIGYELQLFLDFSVFWTVQYASNVRVQSLKVLINKSYF